MSISNAVIVILYKITLPFLLRTSGQGEVCASWHSSPRQTPDMMAVDSTCGVRLAKRHQSVSALARHIASSAAIERR